MYTVEMGVKGAYRIVTKNFISYDNAVQRAERWARSNSIGSYWAVVSYQGTDIKRYNIGS